MTTESAERTSWKSVDPRDFDDPQALAEHLEIEIWRPGPEASSLPRTVARTMRESRAGRLPQRYATDSWRVPFDKLLDGAVQPGMRILDVGAGSLPVLPVGARPEGVEYVGLDVELDELVKAPAGSYDDMVAADITVLQPELVGQFDLVLSWLTMEHVKPVPRALENLRRYQRDGGRFLGYLAGAWSVASVLNRAVPHPIAKRVMQRLMDREPDTVFRAHYDHCTRTQLSAVGERVWSSATVTPIFTAGWYFAFSPVLRGAYLAYEEWAVRSGRADLAPYYIVDATA